MTRCTILRASHAKQVVFFSFLLGTAFHTTTACTFSTSQPPKVVRARCFAHFAFQMCFVPQRGTFFRYVNFQKWFDTDDISTSRSGPNIMCFLYFGKDIRFAPQRRAVFSTSQLPKVVRRWCALYILTWKCVSRHNRMQLFIFHPTTWLRTYRLSEPPFRPPGATNHSKHMF